MEECQKLVFQVSNVSREKLQHLKIGCVFGPPTLKIVLPALHCNLRSETYCWKVHLQIIPDKENQAAYIRIIIHATEKRVHLPLCDPLEDLAPRRFARSFAWSRSTGSHFNDKPGNTISSAWNSRQSPARFRVCPAGFILCHT